MREQSTVSGLITQPEGSRLAGVTVRAIDKDLPSLGARSEQQLGYGAITDAEVCYQTAFPEKECQQGESRRRGKVRPDLFSTDRRGDLQPQAVQLCIL
jgi:hypothetical protein